MDSDLLMDEDLDVFLISRVSHGDASASVASVSSSGVVGGTRPLLFLAPLLTFIGRGLIRSRAPKIQVLILLIIVLLFLFLQFLIKDSRKVTFVRRAKGWVREMSRCVTRQMP